MDGWVGGGGEGRGGRWVEAHGILLAIISGSSGPLDSQPAPTISQPAPSAHQEASQTQARSLPLPHTHTGTHSHT